MDPRVLSRRLEDLSVPPFLKLSLLVLLASIAGRMLRDHHQPEIFKEHPVWWGAPKGASN